MTGDIVARFAPSAMALIRELAGKRGFHTKNDLRVFVTYCAAQEMQRMVGREYEKEKAGQ